MRNAGGRILTVIPKNYITQETIEKDLNISTEHI